MFKFFREAPLLIMIVLVLLIAISLFVGKVVHDYVNDPSVSETKTKSEAVKSKPPPQPGQNDQDDSIPTSRKLLGYILVLMFLLVFVGRMIHARGKTPPTPWKDIFTDTPTLTVCVLVLIWLLIAFLIPKLWDIAWGDQIFFWALNMGLVTIAILRSAKNSRGEKIPATQTAAWIFGIILLIGLVSQFSRNPYWKEVGTSWSSKASALSASSVTPARYEPQVMSTKTELPLPPSCIADRESGDGTPGSARQFMKDGVTPVLNPLNLLAVGTWQINLADPAVLALVKKEKLDVEYSKEDNDAAASLLYAEKPGGNLDPWKATSSCVGSNTIELALEAPTNRFGEGKRMIPGRPTDIYGNGKRYTLRFNRTVEEDWPLPSGATSRAPAEVTFLEAKSRENHLISIKVVMR